jgi:hypothetical protein
VTPGSSGSSRGKKETQTHPALYVFVAVMWGVIAEAALVVLLAFRPVNAGKDWSLLVFVVAGDSAARPSGS